MSEPEEFMTELELIDATEVVQVVRRPDETLEVDVGDLDSDTAIALMVKAVVKLALDEILEVEEYEDEDEEEDEDEA